VSFLGDLRLALRGFRRNPGFTAVVVAVLALGIGANSAIFSVVDALVLRPLPFPEADRLVTVHTRNLQTGRIGPVSFPDIEDVRAQLGSLQGPVIYRPRQMALGGLGESEMVDAVIASAGLFRLLGVPPVLGRGFADGEDEPGRPRVAVVSQGFWRRRLGGDPRALGRTLTVDGEPVTVVGVAASGFRFPLDEHPPELWLPLDRWIDKSARQWRSMLPYRSAIARLRPGATIAQAQAELNALRAGQARAYPKEDAGSVLVARSFHDEWVAGERTSLLVLLGAVAIVLLIACANVSSLLLARAVARRHELAVRAALGAGRRRLARQLLTESGLLVVVSAGLGLGAAWLTLDLLVAAIPADLPRPHAITLDGRVLGYTLAIAAGCALFIGAAPALVAVRSNGGAVLGHSERGATGGRSRLLTGLLLAEIALTMVLVVGAGLLVRTFARVSGIDPGFEPRALLAARIRLGASNVKGEVLYQRLNEGLERLPGVQGFALGNPLPFVGWMGGTLDFTLGDRSPPPPGATWRLFWHMVSPSYFGTLGIPLVKGRAFDRTDTADSPRVAIINESFARRHFPGSDPIGRHVLAYNQFDWRIVGVVADTRGTTCPPTGCYGLAATLEEPPEPSLYSSLGQTCCGSFELDVVVRHPSPASLAAPLRALVRDIDPSLAVHEVRTIEDAIAGSLAQRRLNTWLLSAWAGLALLLAALGIYGVLAYGVARRTRELAIRSALGAQARELLALVVGQGLRLALVGVAIGLVGALALTRVLQSQLYGVSATDPATFVVLALLVLGAATIASYLPARRATRVDPMIALREE
jgi:putative ABC transport system permease protein